VDSRKPKKPVSVPEIIGDNLARHRLAKGLSQETVAHRSGKHRSEISLLELGKRMPRVDTVARVAGAIGITMAQALEGVSWAYFLDRPGGYFEPPETDD
jgi:transcriptional regulator with XRE-family HTH domain